MLIGELATASGLSREALRFYEQQGLIRARRLDNGYRDYPPEVVTLVQFPVKVFNVVADLVTGKPRDIYGPISIVGASTQANIAPTAVPGFAFRVSASFKTASAAAVSTESVSRWPMSGRTMSRSTMTSIWCFLFLSS